MDSLSHELDRDRRTAKRDYRGSLMSDTKWRSVLLALADEKLDVRQVVMKFIGVEKEARMHLPWLHGPHKFVDSIEFGPFPLVGIEWLEIPDIAVFPRANNLPAVEHSQNREVVRSTLEAIGKQLPLRDTPTGLRIVGHVR